MELYPKETTHRKASSITRKNGSLRRGGGGGYDAKAVRVVVGILFKGNLTTVTTITLEVKCQGEQGTQACRV